MSGLLCVASGSFWQMLFTHQDIAAVFCLFSMIVLIVVIPVIAGAWVKVSCHREDSTLKQTMLDRGMSADEIERVLQAKSSDK